MVCDGCASGDICDYCGLLYAVGDACAICSGGRDGAASEKCTFAFDGGAVDIRNAGRCADAWRCGAKCGGDDGFTEGMSMTYFSRWTDQGAQKLAASLRGGAPLRIRMLALGDGNGQVVDPSATSVLVREVYRANAVVTASADYPNAIELLLVLPLGVGGFAVREMSAIDENGDTLAIGNLAVMDVPLPGSGEVRECTFKMILVVSNLGSVVLTTDATLISASQKFVTTYVTTSINVHVATANPHPQYMLTTAANVAYSAVGHGHQIAQVAGLQSALDALATKIINTPTAVNLKRVDSKIYFIGQS